MNQNSSLSFCFSWSLTKPNRSNWIVVPIFSSDSFGSPRPFMIELSGILISTFMFSVSAESHWMNFVFKLLSGFSERNERVIGFMISL